MLQALKDWTRWIAGWFAAGIVAAYLISLLPIGRDSTDGTWPSRSGVEVVTDSATGCQYLRTPGGGITPRVNGTGKQLGCNP